MHDLLKVQDRQVDFNVMGKVHDTVSDSTIQATFKKLPLSSFGMVSKFLVWNQRKIPTR